eukprot:TRINITY_DN11657_c0_g1_i1.p1 TRINITY_DN11657_c0_g1~~TRINITY_DN11657_c0_g1_i1.p1  ORF type:complete len:287 (+),score=63.39 TRINITY_DN11657_c0_g1_i1:50-910(+)
MNELKEGWFSEVNQKLWPGGCFSIEVKNHILTETTPYQKIEVFESTNHGMVLILDDIIQLTERDEFHYQEMITQVAMFSHESPKRVFILGGGDGGVLREVARHSCVEEIVMCDIDERVIQISKEYFPTMSSAFSDERLDLRFADGVATLDTFTNHFDIIIVDSTDPNTEFSETLFEKDFFESCKKALRQGGIISTQGESIFLHIDLLKEMKGFLDDVFEVVEYCTSYVPTYPSGNIGYWLLKKDEGSCKKNVRTDQQVLKDLRYYNHNVHTSSFSLPNFAEQILGE